MDRETRSSILPVRTRYRFSSVVERGPPKPVVDCSIQSAGANFFFNYGCGREIRSNATLVATPKSAQNSRLVSVTTTINLWDRAAGTAL